MTINSDLFSAKQVQSIGIDGAYFMLSALIQFTSETGLQLGELWEPALNYCSHNKPHKLGAVALQVEITHILRQCECKYCGEANFFLTPEDRIPPLQCSSCFQETAIPISPLNIKLMVKTQDGYVAVEPEDCDRVFSATDLDEAVRLFWVAFLSKEILA